MRTMLGLLFVAGMTACKPSLNAGDAQNDDAAAVDAISDTVIDSGLPDVRTDTGPRDAIRADVRPDVPVDAGQVACTANSNVCVDANLYRCNADGSGMVFLEACASAALCMSSTGTTCTPPACDAGAGRCTNTMYEVCSADRTGYQAAAACASAALCNAASGCTAPTCQSGDTVCNSCPGMTQDDCLMTCNADLNGYTMVQDCGLGQPSSCFVTDATHAHCG